MSYQPISSNLRPDSGALSRWWRQGVELASKLIPPLGAWRRRAAARDRELGVELFAQGKFDDAATHLIAAIEKDPRNVGYYCDLGQTYYAAGEFAKAKEQYTLAWLLDYDDLRALKGLAYSYHGLGEYSEAIYLYLKYVERNKSDADLLFNLGVALHCTDKYSEAAEYYAKAEELDRDNADIPENRGRALYSLGKMDESIACMSRALELDPERAEAHRFLGLALEANGDIEGAETSYAKAIELDRFLGDAHIDMSRLLCLRNDYAGAVQHDIEAAKVFEERRDVEGLKRAYWELGWDYYKLGDWAKSVDASRKAMKLDPTLYAARFNLALALLHDGQREEAVEEYRRGAAQVTLSSDLTEYAMKDLREALKERPDLEGAHEILRVLEERYAHLRKDHGVSETAPVSAAV